MTQPEAGIEPGVLYVIEDDDGNEVAAAVTPDGIGMHWYDTVEEAIEDRIDLDDPPARVRLTHRELEELRGER